MTEKKLDREPESATGDHKAVARFRVVRVVIALVLLLALSAVTLWAAANRDGVVTGTASEPNVRTVQLDEGSIVYACAPGVADPSVPSGADAPVELLGAGDAQTTSLQGGGFGLAVPSEDALDNPIVPMTSSGVADGDLATYLLESCVLPARHQVLPAGSTSFGEDTVLLLSNPAATPVTAKAQVLSPIGPLLDPAQDILVPANSTIAVLPAIWAPGEVRSGVVVEADGNGVAAWLQSSGLDGEVPLGAGRLAGQTTSDTVTIIGISPDAQSTLRISNISPTPATVSVSVLTAGGPQPLQGVEDLSVEPYGVFDVALGDLPSSAFGLVAEAGTAIAASVREVVQGNPFPEDEALRMSLRSFVGAAGPIKGVTLPGPSQIRDAVQDLGLEYVGAAVTVANLGKESLVVKVGDTEVSLEPGAAEEIELAGTEPQVVVEGLGEVHAALAVTAGTDSGQIRSVTPLEEAGAAQAQQVIALTPSR